MPSIRSIVTIAVVSTATAVALKKFAPSLAHKL